MERPEYTLDSKNEHNTSCIEFLTDLGLHNVSEDTLYKYTQCLRIWNGRLKINIFKKEKQKKLIK